MLCALSFIAYVATIEIVQRLLYANDYRLRRWIPHSIYRPQARIILFHSALLCLSVLLCLWLNR